VTNPEGRSLGTLAEYGGPPAGDAALPPSAYMREGQAARTAVSARHARRPEASSRLRDSLP
jgi:hypothetical protein